MSTDTFKISRPRLSTGLMDKVLIYNRTREKYKEAPLSGELLKLMGVETKVYVNGYFDNDNEFHIINKTTNCRW